MPRKCRIDGVSWTVSRYTRDCFPKIGEADLDRKVIWVDPTLEGKELCITAIHEALHALLWPWDEENIQATAVAVYRALNTAGCFDADGLSRQKSITVITKVLAVPLKQWEKKNVSKAATVVYNVMKQTGCFDNA